MISFGIIPIYLSAISLLLFPLAPGTYGLLIEKLERSCADYDIPGSPLARNDRYPSTFGSSVRVNAGARSKKLFIGKDTFTLRAPPPPPGGCKLDLKTSFTCRPSCWWNEDTEKCNCCPRGSHRCGAGKYCCPLGTYCMKSAMGEAGCCPEGHQCAPTIPEDDDNNDEHEFEMEVSGPTRPRCANPSYELCPSQTFCCPPEWVCYKDGMGTARCGRY